VTDHHVADHPSSADPVAADPTAGAPASVCVLGVGNELFTDEGLGVVAAREVGGWGLPGVEALDGGTLGLALAPEIADRDCLLILDAITAAGRVPGELIELRGEQVPAHHAQVMSVHQIQLGDALAAAELSGVLPKRIVALGIVPFDLTTGFGLSEPMRARLPDLLSAARRVLDEWSRSAPPTPRRLEPIEPRPTEEESTPCTK